MSWGLAIALIILSPIVLIFALPVAIGVGLDIFGHAGEAPVAAALILPVTLMLLGRALARAPLRQAFALRTWSRPHPGHAKLHRPAH